jgi:hypothetical protein
VPLRDAHDATPHRREHAPDVVIRRRRQRHEARAVAGEDALNDERVEVDVQVGRRAEALDRGGGLAAAVGDTRRRARRRSKDGTARMNTASTRRQSRWS